MFEKINNIVSSHLSGSLILLFFFSIIFIAIITYIFIYKPRKFAETEGFVTVPVAEGSVSVNCINSIPELTSIVKKIKSAENANESEDVREFVVLAEKLACFKVDLTTDAATIRASANQPYVNAHDRQPITETLTQCFSKSMPPRDLELIFDLYLSRGIELIKRFGPFGLNCASAEHSYRKIIEDIYNIAKNRCFINPVTKKLIEVNGISQGDFASYELGGASL
jgi:hypothetical protein